MTRLAALVVAGALLAAPVPALADGSGPLQTAGQRLARDAGRELAATAAPLPSGVQLRRAVPRAAADGQQPGGGLSSSGMSRGKKWALGLGLALAFGAAVYAIDQGVEDNTPSSRGLR